MAVDVRAEDGQSIVEFVLLLPLMVGITILMVRMNGAIQVSINNQKYARMQTHFLAFNSPYYPQSNRRAEGMRRLTVGIGENALGEGGRARPKAVEVFVGRKRSVAADASDAPQSEPAKRAHVRIRTTVSLCSYSHDLKDGKKTYDADNLVAVDVAANQSGETTNAGTIYDYCNGGGIQ